MKNINLKSKTTNDKIPRTVSSKQKENADLRYDYLMTLNSDWIATQNNAGDFIRSIN